MNIAQAEVGVWEMTVGTMRDIEIDAVFVVIEGEATVTLLNGDAPTKTIHLRPGTVCRLTAGMATRWSVPSRLRKLYILGAPLGEGS